MAVEVGQLFVSLSMQIAKFEKDVGKATALLNRRLDVMDKSFKKLTTRTFGFRQALVATGVAAGGLATRELFQLNSEVEKLSIRLSRITPQGKSVVTTFNNVSATAKRSGMDMRTLLDAYAKLEVVGIDASKTLDTVVDSVAATGGGAVQLEAVVRALFQTASKANVSLEEMNQIGETGIPATRILKEELGLTVKELRDLTAAGIGSREALDALVTGMRKRFGGAAQEMAATVPGMFNVLKTQLWEIGVMIGEAGLVGRTKELLGAMIDFINTTVADGRMQKWATQIASIFGEMIGALKVLGQFAEVILPPILWIAQKIAQAFMGVVAFVRSIIQALKTLGAFIAKTLIAPLSYVITKLSEIKIGTKQFGIDFTGLKPLADVLQTTTSTLTNIMQDGIEGYVDASNDLLTSVEKITGLIPAITPSPILDKEGKGKPEPLTDTKDPEAPDLSGVNTVAGALGSNVGGAVSVATSAVTENPAQAIAAGIQLMAANSEDFSNALEALNKPLGLIAGILGDAMAPFIEIMADLLMQFVPLFEDVARILKPVMKLLGIFIMAITAPFVAFLEITFKAFEPLFDVFDDISRQIGAVSCFFDNFRELFDKIWGWMVDFFTLRNWVDVFEGIGSAVGSFLETILSGIVTKFAEMVGRPIAEILATMFNLLTLNLFKSDVDAWLDRTFASSESSSESASSAPPQKSSSRTPASSGSSGGLDFDFGGTIFGILEKALKTIIELLKAVVTLLGKIASLLGAPVEFFVDAFGAIAESYEDIADFNADFGDVFNTTLGLSTGGVFTIQDGALVFPGGSVSVEDVEDAVNDAWNNVENSDLNPANWSPGAKINASILTSDQVGQSNNIVPPTMNDDQSAMLSEFSQPEAVLPLTRMSDGNLGVQTSGAGAGAPQSITIQVDGRTFGQWLLDGTKNGSILLSNRGIVAV